MLMIMTTTMIDRSASTTIEDHNSAGAFQNLPSACRQRCLEPHQGTYTTDFPGWSVHPRAAQGRTWYRTTLVYQHTKQYAQKCVTPQVQQAAIIGSHPQVDYTLPWEVGSLYSLKVADLAVALLYCYFWYSTTQGNTFFRGDMD